MKSKKKLTDNHIVLIRYIKKCMLTDESNQKNRLLYTHKWTNKFLQTILNRGMYSTHEADILGELRTAYIDDLKQYYKTD